MVALSGKMPAVLEVGIRGGARMQSTITRRTVWLTAACVLSAPAAFAADPIYQDAGRSFEERAADLVSRMTLEEKISQMQNNAAAIPRLGVPAYEWWNEALHGVARAGAATVF